MAMAATSRMISSKTPINIFFSILAPRSPCAARIAACDWRCNRHRRHYIDREAIRQPYPNWAIPDPHFRGGESIRRNMGDLVNLNKFRKAKQRQSDEAQAGINREK